MSGKVFQQCPDLLNSLLSVIDDYYENSQVQGEGSDWPSITVDQQSLDWQQPTAKLLTTLRVFGSLGTYAVIAGKACIIISVSPTSSVTPKASAHSKLSVSGKCYQHDYTAGQVIVNNDLNITIATVDGELCIPKELLLWG